MKYCSKCGETKLLDAYNNRKSAKDGKRSQCRDCENEYKRQWDIANADRVKQYSHTYYAENAEARKVYSRAYYAANAEDIAESNRARACRWAKENPALARDRNQRRRARQLAATVEDFTHTEKLDYWISNGIDPDHCVYCGGPYEHDDHIIPLSRGGAHERANLAPACQKCNSSKGVKLIQEWQPQILITLGE